MRGDSYGAELSFTYQATDWWRLRGGYNYFQKDLSVKPGRSDSNNATAESNDPTHQALIQSMIDIGKNAEVGVLMRYVSKLPDPAVEAYAGLDVRLAFSPIKNIELSIVGQNLLQKSHLEFIPDSPEAKAIERSAYFRVTCRF